MDLINEDVLFLVIDHLLCTTARRGGSRTAPTHPKKDNNWNPGTVVLKKMTLLDIYRCW